MNCKGCSGVNSNCADVTTSNCVEYRGQSILCLNLCTGDSITTVEETIALKLCELIGNTDVSTVTIPQCLIQAWGTKDKTILEFIKFLLEESCNLQGQVDAINTNLLTFEPMVNVDYKCCANNPCITTGTVTVSVALQNIIDCLCTLTQNLGINTCPLPADTSISCLLQENTSRITALESLVAYQSIQISSLLSIIACFKNILKVDYPTILLCT